jgi:hypothetical protein
MVLDTEGTFGLVSGKELGEDASGQKWWRPLDDRNEDREAREACREFQHSKEGLAIGPWWDGLYELVEERGPPGWTKLWPKPRKTLRRVEDDE